MRSKAEIRLIGYVGRDPKMPNEREYPNWVVFSLWINRRWKDKSGTEQEETTWYECKTNTENMAKIVKDHVKKGIGLLVEGTPKVRAFMSNSGSPEASIEVSINSLDILTYPKDGSGSESTTQPQSSSAKLIANVGYNIPNKSGTRSMKDPLDDEIPF